MTLTLADLSGCFDGVIPSIIATAAADGKPNISYLSHVAMVDGERVALSNQFFAKTAANIRANPRARLLLVHARSGRQFALDLLWESSADRGALFERMARDLKASSAQIGMGDVMRLRAIDIFRVVGIEPCLSASEAAPSEPAPVLLRDVAPAMSELTAQDSIAALLDALLASVRRLAACDHALVLLPEPARAALVTMASVGYRQSGIGSEVPIREGLIGEAAAGRSTFKINDASRLQRFSQAIARSEANEDRTRSIALPSLIGGLSQIAVPMIAQGELRGVLFAESPARLAFDADRQSTLEMLCQQAASSLALLDATAEEGPMTSLPTADRPAGVDEPVHVTAYAFDDSVFIGDTYVIKGVAGRLLVFLLERSMAEARTEFTNREIRLASELKLPEFKDNLETRLLLLRRRLDEKRLPVRLEQIARGRIRLCVTGRPIIRLRWVQGSKRQQVASAPLPDIPSVLESGRCSQDGNRQISIQLGYLKIGLR
ncbi:GAF domain-containing protein [Bosea caraganae]|uniref:GAF domain-containing protein n=1 Tax=Bosea caraganae TaxID=2763117 RepID=A0A370KZE3_9HYPH|nr:GAF domain-containing protein [Bosea caraganae]RDJ20373.1 GAF domain-containing protein [Bosea caraganae]RDJ26546.1 GAF domain-containing protein [Bosea caraganae]